MVTERQHSSFCQPQGLCPVRVMMIGTCLGHGDCPVRRAQKQALFHLWLSFVLPVNVPRSKGKGVAVISPKEL